MGIFDVFRKKTKGKTKDSQKHKHSKVNDLGHEGNVALASAVATNDDSLFKKALGYYDRALKINPLHSPSLFNKGSALEAMGDQQGALGCYEKVLGLEDTNGHIKITALASKAMVLIRLGKKDEATACLVKGLEECEFTKKNADNFYLLGKGFMEVDDHASDGIDCFSKAAKLEHEAALKILKKLGLPHPDAEEWYLKGVKALGEGHISESILYFDNALEISPEFPEAISDKGAALISSKQYEESLKMFNRALKYFKDGDSQKEMKLAVLTNKGIALGNLNRIEEQIVCYDTALSIDPDNAALLERKGDALCGFPDMGKMRESPNIEKAISCYERCVEIDQKSDGAWLSLAYAFSVLSLQKDSDEFSAQSLKCLENSAALGNSFAKEKLETIRGRLKENR